MKQLQHPGAPVYTTWGSNRFPALQSASVPPSVTANLPASSSACPPVHQIELSSRVPGMTTAGHYGPANAALTPPRSSAR